LKQSNKYNLIDKVYIRTNPETEDFSYNDGNETEEYILSVIRETLDLGTGSVELVSKIKDWPTLYHLSPQRADLLRPFSGYLKGKSVLEIGSGCGAITRFLGETAAEVVALEGSRRRAHITSERCRDLTNVISVNDNFDYFSWDKQFDVVTLIGVLEYSNLFIKGTEPSACLLERARSFLKKDGVLIIAIENRLGSKYLAGAPEDHTGQAYYGIENRYSKETATTYGKEELSLLLKKTGYSEMEFLFPFPDYKLPTVILREKYLDTSAFNITNLLMSNADYFQGRTYESTFSLPLALKQIVANKLVADLSNSFLVITGNCLSPLIEDNTIGYTFSSLRKRPYAKENRFVFEENGLISVKRTPLYPNVLPLPHPWLSQHIEQESYLQGNVYFNYFIEIVSRTGWTNNELIEWATPFYLLLKRFADDKEYISGRYVDAIPFNMLLHENSISIFDQEWNITESLPIHYIFCRGIYFAFGRVNVFQRPADGMPTKIFALVEKILAAFVSDPRWVIQDFIEREKKYFGPVNLSLRNDAQPGDADLRFNDKKNEMAIKIAEMDTMITEKETIIEELKTENNLFKKSISWYRNTYQTGSWIRLRLIHLFRNIKLQ
jgi:SAM-dependent methyltransferase